MLVIILQLCYKPHLYFEQNLKQLLYSYIYFGSDQQIKSGMNHITLQQEKMHPHVRFISIVVTEMIIIVFFA